MELVYLTKMERYIIKSSNKLARICGAIFWSDLTRLITAFRDTNVLWETYDYIPLHELDVLEEFEAQNFDETFAEHLI